MGTQEELLARALALRSKLAVKADELAVRSSIVLSRIVFFGILVLPFFQPNTFYIVRVAHLSTPPEIELHARVEVPPAARTVPAAPTISADGHPAPVTADTKGPNVAPATPNGPTVPASPPETDATAKPVPPAKQIAPEWTEAEIASAKQECENLLAKMTVVSEELPPAREGICGAPAPRLLKSVGANKVRIEPGATLTCPMIAGINTWVTEKLQPAAQKNFGSPVVRVVAESYSCRNRYGLARAPISEHALMNAVDVSAFVLADGRIVRVSKSWGPTAEELKRQQKSNAQADQKEKFVAASKLGAHDIAKGSDDKEKAAQDPKEEPKTEEKKKDDEKQKPKSPEALKEEQAKQAMSAFLHQAHDGACDIFGTVLGPDTNEAHHDHFHLDMKERQKHRTLCQ